jgi:hypothetical protein
LKPGELNLKNFRPLRNSNLRTWDWKAGTLSTLPSASLCKNFAWFTFFLPYALYFVFEVKYFNCVQALSLSKFSQIPGVDFIKQFTPYA